VNLILSFYGIDFWKAATKFAARNLSSLARGFSRMNSLTKSPKQRYKTQTFGFSRVCFRKRLQKGMAAQLGSHQPEAWLVPPQQDRAL
jgi:hypothetical protein